jgi:hypothetical protein
MTSETFKTVGPHEKRLVDALRVADAKRDRTRRRRRLRLVTPVGHHEAELNLRH